MHDALTFIVHLEIGDAEFGAIIFQRLHLNASHFIFDAFFAIRRCWYVMIRNRECCIRPADFAPSSAKPFECLRTGDLMHEVAVDIQHACAIVRLMHEVRFKDFIKEGFWRIHTVFHLGVTR